MFDERYFFECLKGLLDIDSTTGQFREIQDWLLLELNRLGYESRVFIEKPNRQFGHL